ncbi:MAG: GNAT family N-acetyltransferase [Gemmatimonadetes bacterium]|nr:GNAT family N-acetyltransferase [Gemmatimonadota bacterium]
MKSEYNFTVLAPTHDVGAFSSGRPEIDEYLLHRASVDQALNLCQVFVMADDSGRVRGYGTLSPVSMRVEGVLLNTIGITGVPYRNIGGYLLGRMGVDKRIQGRGIGSAIVARVAQIAARQRDITGGVFLAVDAKDEPLVQWYQKLGFVRLAPAPKMRLVMPLASVP